MEKRDEDNVLHNLAADRECRWDWGEGVVRLLLQNNCEADGKDEPGRTPLHWACENNHHFLIELFLNGPGGPLVNIHAMDLRGKTALHLGATQGWVDIVQLLQAKGASVTAVSDGNWTPLHNACDGGNVAAVCTLLHHGAPVNSLLLNGVPPLHLAAQAGHLGVVECLLERPDLKYNLRDNWGGTPFSRAATFKGKVFYAY
jgi:ankyrin repeat protein